MMSSPSLKTATRLTRTLVTAVPRLPAAGLGIYLAEILDFNATIGLVSRRDAPSVLDRIVRQSAAMLEFVEGCEMPIGGGGAVVSQATPFGNAYRVVDIGTGAGFPGVVWKLLRPDLDILLVERRERRAVFLERIVRELEMDGLSVYPGDASEIRSDTVGGAFDLAASVAVGPPEVVASLVTQLVRRGGAYCSTVPAGVVPTGAVGEAWVRSRVQSWGHSTLVTYLRRGSTDDGG